MIYRVLLEPEARTDIQEGIDWYNKVESGLGKRFLSDVEAQIDYLSKSPFHQIRYDNVRCLPLEIFPYMIHYTVDEDAKTIIIRAVFSTFISPERWQKR